MRVFTLIYIGAALIFFFNSDEFLYLLNIGPKVFRAFEVIPQQGDIKQYFWTTMAAALMLTLAAVTLWASFYPKSVGYFFIHLLSKVASLSGFIFLFLKQAKYFAYALAASVDAIIILVLLIFYLKGIIGSRFGNSSEEALGTPSDSV